MSPTNHSMTICDLTLILIIWGKQNFKVQLAPFTKEVERSGSGTFEWINGSSTVQPPPGFEDYFGAPPHHRFLNFDGLDTVDNTLEQIRDFPPGKTAEDAMRRITLGGEFTDGRALSRAMKKLFEMLDVDCEIDVSRHVRLISRPRPSLINQPLHREFLVILKARPWQRA